MKVLKKGITIKKEQYEKYMENGKDFINEEEIFEKLEKNSEPSAEEIRTIIEKSKCIETLTPDETAKLINLKDEVLWDEVFQAAKEIKKKVYDNRIVTFAPLYCSNTCVNNCLYCGFRSENKEKVRKTLTMEEVKRETEVLAGKIGHKRLIAVYGEHPETGADYIADTIKAVYSVKVKTKKGMASIRRVNINAAPMSVEDFAKLQKVGIGTYQVFQETYHHETYDKVHPKGTLKNNYPWRLYTHHRAMEAGIDDVATGVLFGLYDWRFEVMGLQYHALELEKRFNGVGPHTVSFPRLQPAQNAPYLVNKKYAVSDEDFKKIIAIVRLSTPYTGIIITARESEKVRDEIIPMGCTQTDCSTKIGIGAYTQTEAEQKLDEQQFLLGDTRSLDEMICNFAKKGIITSFCTAGYRCGRTGEKIMGMLKCGTEAPFCKINAILTYREWLDDFASEETKKYGEKVIQKELVEVKKMTDTYSPHMLKIMQDYYDRIEGGERDLFV